MADCWAELRVVATRYDTCGYVCLGTVTAANPELLAPCLIVRRTGVRGRLWGSVLLARVRAGTARILSATVRHERGRWAKLREAND
ncbi:UNVERIFIED_CONTAM: hypothetical protein RKD50_009045 [Streptomyces canus]|jgi:hypothetical protein